MGLKWWFPESGGRGEGFNQGGMSQFTDDHLYREMVQNSLDARSGSDDAVLVELAEIDLDTSWIDGTGLAETIGRCSKSKYVTTEQDRRQLDDARRLLTDGTVRTLSVTDLGTTGTQDEPESDGGLSRWEGLTDSEGSPVAKNERSGGSFGLGKYAPLAATPLRTVLYSTRYRDAAGGTHTRFRGRAVLVTHEGPDEQQKSADGYLGDGDGQTFATGRGDSVPFQDGQARHTDTDSRLGAARRGQLAGPGRVFNSRQLLLRSVGGPVGGHVGREAPATTNGRLSCRRKRSVRAATCTSCFRNRETKRRKRRPVTYW